MNDTTPVRHEIHVAASPADTFRAFTERVGEWWPLATHSLSVGACGRSNKNARSPQGISSSPITRPQAGWPSILILASFISHPDRLSCIGRSICA